MSGVSAYSLQSLRVTYTARRKSSLVTTIQKLRRTLEWISHDNDTSTCQKTSGSARLDDSYRNNTTFSECNGKINGHSHVWASSGCASAVRGGSPSVDEKDEQAQTLDKNGVDELAFSTAKKVAAAPSDIWPVPRRVGRRQWRVTYLKSPFKYKYALRHYVFEDYRYAFDFYDVQKVQQVLSASLGAMDSGTCCSCRFSWHFPGDSARQEREEECAPLEVSSGVGLGATAKVAESKPNAQSFGSSSSASDGAAAASVFRATDAPAAASMLLTATQHRRRQQLIRRCLEESQAVERIMSKLHKKARQWYPGKSYWAPG